jgi:hypothetical protein
MDISSQREYIRYYWSIGQMTGLLPYNNATRTTSFKQNNNNNNIHKHHVETA